MSRRGRRALLAGAAVLTATGTAGGAALLLTGGGSGEPPHTGPRPATATVERTTLLERKIVSGTLGYAGRTEVAAAGQGTLIWRPRAGRVIRPGGRLYRSDGSDVLLLEGAQPAYRPLKNGDEGPDVAQFEKALSRLGYGGFTVDDAFSEATAAAVRRWQKDHGLEETGVVDPATVWFAPGPVRVAAREAALGASLAPGTPVLTVTSLRRVVVVPLKVTDRRLVRKGGAVTVTLPGGKDVKGKVSAISPVVKRGGDPSGGGDPTVDVTITLGTTSGMFDTAPVEVSLVSDRRKNALAVPVSALLALPGGGYGVTVVGPDGATRTVEVTTGMFAGGRVEVTGEGLTAGTRVEVPR
ncbi:peptidoglycan-binding protein [Microtetraspora niveoalba]|uniref:peptidoglycan-binding protein n=1 Tax=Microtetraspora niveoalba TaxID=46175 RepID=UPI00082D1A2D|nr:peptidoglycan-binding protein [Microtetraspora niveoalba]